MAEKIAAASYVAHAEWDGYNWVATVDGLPGAVTQAKRLELLPARLVEIIKLMTGKTVTVDDISVQAHVDDDLDQVAADIAALESELEGISTALAERRRRVARQLRKRGLPLRDIGVIAHISHQRVHQLLSEMDEPRSRRR